MRIMERINPLAKMLAILIAAVLLTFNHRITLNFLMFAGGMILILFFSKAEKKRLLKFLVPMLIVISALFMAGYLNSSQTMNMNYAIGTKHVENVVQNGPVYTGLQLSSRVLAYIGIGLLFALTTPPEDFIMSLMHQAHVKPKFSYGILAAFHLMPEIGAELEAARLAYRVQGISVGRLSLKPVFAALVNCIRWSENLAMAMESKGFDGDGSRTFAREFHVHWYDAAFLILLPALVLIGMNTLPV